MLAQNECEAAHRKKHCSSKVLVFSHPLRHTLHRGGDCVKMRSKRERKGPKLKIEPAAAVMLTALLLTDRSGLAIAALLAAAVHEAGHLCAAKFLHIPVRALRFHLLGAGLETGGRLLSYGEEFLLCAAGPLASLVFAILPAPLWQKAPFAAQLSCTSLMLGLLNLLPIRSFDGGRMLEDALSAKLSVRAADTVLTASSLVFLFLLWATAVYFLLRAGDGLSLWCFSMSLFSRFFAVLKREDSGE